MVPFEAHRRSDADVDVVEVRGELDMLTAREVQPFFDACVRDGSGSVVADYSGVGFIDSVAIGQLLTVRRVLAQELRRLVVVTDLGKVRRVLAMTGADQALPVFATLPSALAAVRAD